MNRFLCELCYPTAKEVGEIAPGFELIFLDGAYHILAGQGHKDDIIYSFKHKPMVDPCPESDGSDEKQEEIGFAWIDKQLQEVSNIKWDICDAHEIWDAHKDKWSYEKYPYNFDIYFCNLLGKMVADFEKGNAP